MKKKKKSRAAQIIICGFTYQVAWCDEIRDQNDNRLLGETSYDNHLIKIQNDMDEEQTQDVLHHEILHAIIVETGARNLFQREGIKDTNEFEELFIRMISPALTQALRTLK